MADPSKRVFTDPITVGQTRYAKRVRKGFVFLLKSLTEDTGYGLLDPRAPWFRNLPYRDAYDLAASLRWIIEQSVKEGTIQLPESQCPTLNSTSPDPTPTPPPSSPPIPNSPSEPTKKPSLPSA